MTTITTPNVGHSSETFDPLNLYPPMLRIGHRYEISLGQRLAQGGFKGPQDVAVGPDGWPVSYTHLTLPPICSV